jgi:hypothetical protein
MASFREKLGISFYAAVLFVVVSLPITYSITNSISPVKLYDFASNCPTFWGHLVHTLVFFLITYFSMTGVRDSADKLKFSLYGTIVYYIISNPWLSKSINASIGGVFSEMLSTVGGCPNVVHIILHGVIYMFVILGMMYLPL